MSKTYDLMQLLDHVAATVAKQSDQVLQEQLGIGLSQFKILQVLQAEPRTPQREIARSLGQTEASISRQVKLMLEQGLIHIFRGPDDHRQHLTVVTHKGERLAMAALIALARYHRPTVSALTEKQQEQLVAALETLHRQLCVESHATPAADQPL